MDKALHKTSPQLSKETAHCCQGRFDLEGMECSDCALVIEHRLGRLDGVVEVQVDYAQQSVQVAYDARHIDRRGIEKRIEQMGYTVVQDGLRRWYQDNRELLFSLAGGVVLLAAWLGERLATLPAGVLVVLYLAAYGLSGFDVVRHTWHALRQRHFDTDALMVMAALGAVALGEFAEGALLLFLFGLGHALEERALDHARHAVRALGSLAPRSALALRGGVEVMVPVERLELGEIVIVRPGERLPVDGEVTEGCSSVDQSPITGESLPVDKMPGERVYAGSVNGEGALHVRVVRLARDSTLARVTQLVEQAQANKAPTQQLVDRFSRVFVPVVLVVVGLLLVIPPLFGVPFAEAFSRAMTLLVAVSPCALALGTPSAILAGVAQAARNGVLVKGGVHLENLGRLGVIAFDKTGTLTRGALQVADVVAEAAYSEASLLALAVAVERHSAHPLAQAVAREAAARELLIPQASQVEAQTGRGVQASLEGQILRVGSLRWLEDCGLVVSPSLRERAIALEQQGKTVVWVAVDQALAGLIAIADQLRPDAAPALAELRRLGVQRMVMLSGDNPRAAAYIARQVGLSEYRADLLPEDKLLAIDELLKEQAVVGMVGDGVNDAPALARATLGIAMGGAATDVALETADVALMASDLSKLPFAIGIGRATRRVIWQNLVIAVGVMLVLSGLALSGLTGIGAAVVFHEGSTLLVVANALRLLRYSQ